MLSIYNPWKINKNYNPFEELFNASNKLDFGMETLKNEDGSISVSMDLPGIKEADLSIEILDGQISVSGQRKTATSQYSVQKSLSLPEGCDQDNVKAELKDGVLTLTFTSQVKQTKEAKKIPLTSSETK